jgi:hypothetical protein
MTIIGTTPTAVPIGAADLPFVDVGGGEQEYDHVNGADSLLYEPAGSIRTLQLVETTTRSGSRCTGST